MGIRRVAGLTWNRLLMMRVDNSAGMGTSGMAKFGVTRVARMAYSPRLWLMAIGW
jgi:hypothetical protein